MTTHTRKTPKPLPAWAVRQFSPPVRLAAAIGGIVLALIGAFGLTL